MTNCIKIMPNQQTEDLPKMTRTGLRAIRSLWVKPFQLELPEQRDSVICYQLLRVMPGKRLVAFATWGDKTVVAKLFFAKKDAMRHAKRDAEGMIALVQAAVLAPAIYYQGPALTKSVHVILYEKIPGQTLEAIWQAKKSIQAIKPLLQAMTIELATQHVLGVLQHDLHFKNFIIQKKRIYTIDGGALEIFDKPLSKEKSIKNLALFFSQLGVGRQRLKDQLFVLYSQSRGWVRKDREVLLLQQETQKWQAHRLQDYQQKVMRQCSAFMRLDTLGSLIMYDRAYENPDLAFMLQHPDTVIAAETLLKDGRSSTVATVMIQTEKCVIKRYNIKDFFHGLRRCFRSTRAAEGWLLGQTLQCLDIPTAKPIAFIEKRFLKLRTTSYLITEYVQGVSLQTFFDGKTTFSKEDEWVAKNVTTLLAQLFQARLTHGDLKATNILIREDGRAVLIDLDGMQQHRSNLRFKRAYMKDMQRFMQNWRLQPTVSKLFKHLLNDLL